MNNSMNKSGNGKQGVVILLSNGDSIGPIAFKILTVQIDDTSAVQLLNVVDDKNVEYTFNMRHVVGWVIQEGVFINKSVHPFSPAAN